MSLRFEYVPWNGMTAAEAGYALGAHWAAEVAEPQDLENLAAVRGDLLAILGNDETAPAEFVAVICGPDGDLAADPDAFWSWPPVVPEEYQHFTVDPEFVRAFAQGALSVERLGLLVYA